MSTNKSPEIPGVLVDLEANKRYEVVIKAGREIFAGSALLDSYQPITESDIHKISQFHRLVSPTNPNSPWRTTKEDRSTDRGQIADPSFFSNWEQPGGPLEHIELAGASAEIITKLIKQHLKKVNSVDEPWALDAIQQLKVVNPKHAQAAALLHDEGREVTHTFFTTDLIGNRLLMRMGIRDDIRAVLTGEEVMQVPPEKSMDEFIQNLPAESVIIRIADEFGKRFPGSNRLYQPEDYDAWDRNKWAQGYTSRPLSGRPSDAAMRNMMPLHVDNVPRYFKALDNWIQSLTNLTLKDLTTELNRQLSPTLPILN